MAGRLVDLIMIGEKSCLIISQSNMGVVEIDYWGAEKILFGCGVIFG